MSAGVATSFPSSETQIGDPGADIGGEGKSKRAEKCPWVSEDASFLAYSLKIDTLESFIVLFSPHKTYKVSRLKRDCHAFGLTPTHACVPISHPW